jgi:hypothetical protein
LFTFKIICSKNNLCSHCCNSVLQQWPWFQLLQPRWWRHGCPGLVAEVQDMVPGTASTECSALVRKHVGKFLGVNSSGMACMILSKLVGKILGISQWCVVPGGLTYDGGSPVCPSPARANLWLFKTSGGAWGCSSPGVKAPGASTAGSMSPRKNNAYKCQVCKAVRGGGR